MMHHRHPPGSLRYHRLSSQSPHLRKLLCASLKVPIQNLGIFSDPFSTVIFNLSFSILFPFAIRDSFTNLESIHK